MNNGSETINRSDSKLPTNRSNNSHTRIKIGLQYKSNLFKYRTWRSVVFYKMQHTRFGFRIFTTFLNNFMTFWTGARKWHQYCLQVEYIVFQVETICKLSEHLPVVIHAMVTFTDICNLFMFIMIQCAITNSHQWCSFQEHYSVKKEPDIESISFYRYSANILLQTKNDS